MTSKNNGSKKAAEASPQPAPQASADSVDQIRDIIFGAQMREYEQRFAELEQRLIENHKSLQQTLETQISDAVTELDVEKANREKAIDELVARFEESTSALREETTAIKARMAEQAESTANRFEQLKAGGERERAEQLSRLAALFRGLADELDPASKS